MRETYMKSKRVYIISFQSIQPDNFPLKSSRIVTILLMFFHNINSIRGM